MFALHCFTSSMTHQSPSLSYKRACMHIHATPTPLWPQPDFKIQLRWLGLMVTQEKVLSPDRQKEVAE